MRIGGRIFIGGNIHTPGTGRATLGCFINDDDGLGFTVPRHTAVKDIENPLWTPVRDTEVNGNDTILSTIRTDTNLILDTCLAYPKERELLKTGICDIPYINKPFAGVWDPSDILKRKEQAAASADLEKISAETIPVSHLGASRSELLKESKIEFDGILHCGLIVSTLPRLQMRGRTVYSGDSGGPVFTDDYKLVGFVSLGEERAESVDTTVVLAYYVFNFLKCSLATSL